MNDDQILGMLADARQNIGQAAVTITRIARFDPGLAKTQVPSLRRLAKTQRRLERDVQLRLLPQVQPLGFITPLIIGGMALVGLGGWVFKHHEDTSLERYKIESIEKCVEENVGAGLSRDEASRVCKQLFGGRDLANVFSELSRTVLIASVAIVGVYIVLKWKK